MWKEYKFLSVLKVITRETTYKTYTHIFYISYWLKVKPSLNFGILFRHRSVYTTKTKRQPLGWL